MRSTECGFVPLPNGAHPCDLLVRWGPTLTVSIGFDPTFDHAALSAGKIPVPGITDLHALVDTGASECCIDNDLAGQLNLPIVDRRLISGAHGAHEVNIHMAQIHIPGLAFTIYGAFAAVALHAGGQAHRALIGRTFLRHHRMIYNGITGEVTIEEVPPVIQLPTFPLPPANTIGSPKSP